MYEVNPDESSNLLTPQSSNIKTVGSNTTKPPSILQKDDSPFTFDDDDESWAPSISSEQQDETNDNNDTNCPTNRTKLHNENDNEGQVPTTVRAPSQIASLDFETIVNTFSISATRERFLLPPVRRSDRSDVRGDAEEGATSGTSGYAYDTFRNKGPPEPKPEDGTKKGKDRPVRRRHRKKLSWRGYTGRTFFRWALVVLTGVLTGLVTILILVSTEYLISFRLENMSKIETASRKAVDAAVANFAEGGLDGTFSSFYRKYLFQEYARVFINYLLLNLGLALASSAMCLLVAPEAIGSGIPECIAYLNGVRVRRFTKPILLVVKVVGTVLSVSSSLIVGPEGPLVHLGAVIGAGLTKSAGLERFVWNVRTSWEEVWRVFCCKPEKHTKFKDDDKFNDDSDDDSSSEHSTAPGPCCSGITNLVSDLSHLRNDAERRDLISIGAAAGFAAAFGAPVGGVLFSLEEASTFFARNLLWKTLTATAAATFCVAVYRGDLAEYGVVSLNSYAAVEDAIFFNRVAEVPLYVLTGAVGGLLGAAFNAAWRWMGGGRKRFFEREHLASRTRKVWKLSEVAVLSVFTSAVLFTLPLVTDWSCRAPKATALSRLVGDGADDDGILTFDHRLNCKASEVNELGVIFFGSREEAIKSILADPEAYDYRTLLTVGLVFFPLMTLTFGVSLPSGIFMPTVLVGSALGGCAGIAFDTLLPAHKISPSTFALLGAAALLAGIQRNVVSLCVILVEGTGQTQILIPVILTVVVARHVGDRFGPGIYHIAMEIKGYPYLDHYVRTEFVMFRVEEIMSTPVRVVRPVETVGAIEKLLLDSSHNGFPVVDGETGKFLGLVRRDQLAALLQCGVFKGRKVDRARTMGRNRSIIDDPLHNLALHIKDDRFSSLPSLNGDTHTSDEASIELQNQAIGEDDVYDEDAWFVDNIHVASDGKIRTGLDDALPRRRSGGRRAKTRDRKDVVAKRNGKLVVTPREEERSLHVDIGAAMNRGAYCVTEGCPASKAYQMYTALGLRHLVVLGGKGGGDVVGILTRSNFDLGYMEGRTRYELRER